MLKTVITTYLHFAYYIRIRFDLGRRTQKILVGLTFELCAWFLSMT